MTEDPAPRVMPSRPFRLRPPVVPENDLAVAVARALLILLPPDAVFTGWDLSNAGPVEGARKKRLGCIAGWPDCGVFWRGRVVLLELKRQRGGVLSDAQKSLHPRLAAAGFPVVVCRSLDDALAAVEAAGVPLRGRVMG